MLLCDKLPGVSVFSAHRYVIASINMPGAKKGLSAGSHYRLFSPEVDRILGI